MSINNVIYVNKPLTIHYYKRDTYQIIIIYIQLYHGLVNNNNKHTWFIARRETGKLKIVQKNGEYRKKYRKQDRDGVWCRVFPRFRKHHLSVSNLHARGLCAPCTQANGVRHTHALSLETPFEKSCVHSCGEYLKSNFVHNSIVR